MVHWQNWSGSAGGTPKQILYPRTEAQIIDAVNEARENGGRLRVVGSGHSFMPLVPTPDTLISLDEFTGLEHIDTETQQATVRAGTKIKALGELLDRHGLAQINLGDIDVQSIAGAISTGTHGTGITLGSIATQVTALTLVTADGTALHCSETEDREVFKAAQVSLGVLGVISRVTLQAMPAYRLAYTWRKAALSDLLRDLGRLREDNRHFEFFWIPYTDTALVKTMNPTDAPAEKPNTLRRFNEVFLENGALWLLSEVARLMPRSSRNIARLMGTLVSSGQDVTPSHRTFATVRAVKFQEMEYSIPANALAECLQEIDASIRQHRFKVHFPVECRYVAGDDIPLSPAFGRDSAFVAVHMYRGMDYAAYFAEMERILRGYDGRPHWGKLNTATAADFRAMYPRWDDFLAVRDRLDPDGLFLNDYTERVFAAAAAQGSA